MEPRACGIETEYALSLERRDRSLGSVDPGLLFQRLEEELMARHRTLESDSFGRQDFGPGREGIEIREGRFLECGARFYYDTGHVEWATPETPTPREAALYELAGERTLAQLARQTAPPGEARLMLVKNNVDYAQGATYGCHENFQIRRAPSHRQDRRLFADLVHHLVPFLVTRQLYCGAGRLGSAGTDSVGFQISQRADYIERVVSPDARNQRALVNDRDESLGDDRRFRRLHLILGDSNRNPMASLLKVGATALVLQMWEAGRAPSLPALAQPVEAFKLVSRDLSCRRSLLLQDGRASTAVEIQRIYLEAAERFLGPAPDGAGAEILALWREALDDLTEDPWRLADRVDWVAKLRHVLSPLVERRKTTWAEVTAWNQIIERLRRESPRLGADGEPTPAQYARFQFLVERSGLRWNSYPEQLRLFFELRERDLRYHDIDDEHSLFGLLTREGLVRRAFDEGQIRSAQRDPPRSRARLRAEIIRWAHREGRDGETLLDWSKAALVGCRRNLLMEDPLAFDEGSLRAFLDGERGAEEIPPRGEEEIQIRILGVDRVSPPPGSEGGFRSWLQRIFNR